MADLGRGLLASWSQAQWDKLDALASKHFDGAAVFAATWSPRTAPVDTPSVRIGGADISVDEASSSFTFNPAQHSDADLESHVINAAFQLALEEDRRCVGVLSKAGSGVPLPLDEHAVKAFADAETKFRTSPRLAGNLELAVFVGYGVHAALDSQEFASTTQRNHLETRFGTQLSRTVALDPAVYPKADPKRPMWYDALKVLSILTARTPRPLEIVRTDQPRLRVVSLEKRSINFELVVSSAVGIAQLANVVLLEAP